MKHLIETIDSSSLTRVDYDRIVLDSTANDVIVKGGGYEYELVTDSYIYNETDNKYYQKLVAYSEPIETNATVDLNSEWISGTTDDEYNYFKSDSYDVDTPFSQCKVTWSNLTSVTFKYMSNSDMGGLFVGNLDGNKFTLETNPDEEVYQSTIDKTPGIYNEFTIECDEGEHHIWFCYAKMEGATDEDRGFIGVSKYSSPIILDVKQGSELPTEYKYGGISAENNKTYDINFNNVTLPNGSIVTDVEKTEKAINTEYVDLGLPSGLKWAKCNIGATTETDYGVYFQWGETSGINETLLGKYSDENYSWATAPFNNGASDYDETYFNSVKDTVCPNGILAKEYDTATQIMGGNWRMPTQTEWQELLDNTTSEWTTINGVNGRKFTSKINGNTIFIPTAGGCGNGSVNHVGDSGSVWSSSLYASDPYRAWYLNFTSYNCNKYGSRHFNGLSVRGVRK